MHRLFDLLVRIEAGRSFGAASRPALDSEWGIVKVSAMTWGEFRPDENKVVHDVSRVDPRHEIRVGDVLVSRANTAEYVGAPVLVAHTRPRLLLSDKSLRLVPKPGVDPAYLHALMSAPQTRRRISALATGTKESMRNISQTALLQVEVPPLPSGPEQRRIVDLLEDHLSRLEAAEQMLRASVRRLTSLRDAALSESVAVASAARGVQVSTLADLAQVSSGVTPLKGNKAFHEGGTIPWVTSGDLHQGVVTEAKHFVTQAALDQTTLKLVPAGAILIAMYGEGRTRGTAAELAIDATTNQACAAVQLRDPTLRSWVRLVLDANYSVVRRLAAGGVQPNLNLKMVKAIEIAIPPAPLREDLLARQRELDDARARLAAQLDSARLRGARLRAAVLAAAFSGQLTHGGEWDDV